MKIAFRASRRLRHPMAILREFRVQGFEKRVREVDQTKAAHTAHGTVPGPAAFLQRGRLPTKKLALAPALEYKRLGIRLWPIPPRSPDLNPVELFWSWLRRDLAKRDLQDLLARRAVLSKEDYRRRIQGILRGRRAQEVAANCTKSFRKACTLVVKNSGGAGK